jgi:RHS repeat-associated protein
MPAAVTAPTASGAEAECPENRVKALDVLSWPRIGVRSPESPDRRWESWPRYDGKAVGTVLARYYDPTVGQFLTVDPMVASTLAPYGYVAGDPLNASDPSGECIAAVPCPEPGPAPTWNGTYGEPPTSGRNGGGGVGAAAGAVALGGCAIPVEDVASCGPGLVVAGGILLIGEVVSALSGDNETIPELPQHMGPTHTGTVQPPRFLSPPGFGSDRLALLGVVLRATLQE